MTAPQVSVPPGDPAGLESAAAALDRVAAALGGRRQQLGTHNARLRQIWSSDSAAPLALLQAGTLQTAAEVSERSVRDSAAAVRGYGTALAQAQQTARVLQQQVAAIEEQTRAELARAPAASQQIIDRAEAAYRPLQARYRQLLEELDQSARRVRATLESLVPTYRPGMIGSDAASQAVAGSGADRAHRG